MCHEVWDRGTATTSITACILCSKFCELCHHFQVSIVKLGGRPPQSLCCHDFCSPSTSNTMNHVSNLCVQNCVSNICDPVGFLWGDRFTWQHRGDGPSCHEEELWGRGSWHLHLPSDALCGGAPKAQGFHWWGWLLLWLASQVRACSNWATYKPSPINMVASKCWTVYTGWNLT